MLEVKLGAINCRYRGTGLTCQFESMVHNSLSGTVFGGRFRQSPVRYSILRDALESVPATKSKDSESLDSADGKDYTITVCRSGEIGRRTGLKIRRAINPWGFDSPLRHLIRDFDWSF